MPKIRLRPLGELTALPFYREGVDGVNGEVKGVGRGGGGKGAYQYLFIPTSSPV